jgi:hypothetical protein
LAGDSGSNRSQFDVGIFERLLEAIDEPCAVGGQAARVAGQVWQFPQGPAGTKLAREPAVLEEVGNPLGVFEIRFASGTALMCWALQSTSSISPSNAFQRHFHYTPVLCIATASQC